MAFLAATVSSLVQVQVPENNNVQRYLRRQLDFSESVLVQRMITHLYFKVLIGKQVLWWSIQLYTNQTNQPNYIEDLLGPSVPLGAVRSPVTTNVPSPGRT